MDEIKKLGLMMGGGVILPLILILFLALLCSQSSSGGEAVVVVANDDFSIPFESSSMFSVTSPFGYRLDPLGSGETKFHSGIDLGSPCGTDVLASVDGVVYEVGFSESGLGNYVYLKHQTSNGILYSAYGHMLDDSIAVEKDEPVVKGQKLGQVGSTGASTGCHLHFMIMKNKISFNNVDLIDPHFVIYGLY